MSIMVFWESFDEARALAYPKLREATFAKTAEKSVFIASLASSKGDCTISTDIFSVGNYFKGAAQFFAYI